MSRLLSIAPLFLLLVCYLQGCKANSPGSESSQEDASPDDDSAMRRVSTPAGGESGRPRFSGVGDELLLSWTEPSGDSLHSLLYATWTGSGWSEAQTAAEGQNWFVNWADTPGVSRWPGGGLMAHFLVAQQNEENAYAYDIHLAIATDATWTNAALLNDDGTATEHGFVAALSGLGGLIWLDGRSYDSSQAMSLRFARVDLSGNRTDETVLDNRVCDCCPTDAAETERGAVVVYRDRSASEIRDISIVRLENGEWSEPAVVHSDGWEINGCPVNGPAVAARGETVAVAWFTAAGGAPRVLVAFSEDGGRTFSAPVQMNASEAVGRVDIAFASEGAAVVTWLEKRGEHLDLQIASVSPHSRGDAATVVRLAEGRASGYPVLAVRGDSSIVAWTNPEARPSLQTAILLSPTVE